MHTMWIRRVLISSTVLALGACAGEHEGAGPVDDVDALGEDDEADEATTYLTGQLLDTDETPVANAEVVLAIGSVPVTEPVTTNAEGFYTLAVPTERVQAAWAGSQEVTVMFYSPDEDREPYGTVEGDNIHMLPSSLDEMPEYLTRVRGGRPPSPELIAEMQHNYESIGGRSPLTDLTFAQGAALHARLGPRVPVAVGMRNWTPFLDQAVTHLLRTGVTRIIAIPLAPQFSSLSVTKYYDAAAAAMPEGAELVRVATFHAHPLLVDAFAERLAEAAPEPDEDVIFTAHSLPVRVIRAGDRYATEVAGTARAVAARSTA